MPALAAERNAYEQREEYRRFNHAAKCEGQKRRTVRTLREREEDAAIIAAAPSRVAGVDDVRKALQARERATKELAAQLSAMPNGQEKYAGVVACLDQFSQSELAVLLKVSRQRISQMVAAHDVIPF